MTIITTINILRTAGRPEHERIVQPYEDDATRAEIQSKKRGSNRRSVRR